MDHSFFASCHGKGPSDGETAVVKTAGRTLEEYDVYLAFPVDFYAKVKVKLEKIEKPADDKKERHSLHERVVRFVSKSDVVRVAAGFNGRIEPFLFRCRDHRSRGGALASVLVQRLLLRQRQQQM